MTVEPNIKSGIGQRRVARNPEVAVAKTVDEAESGVCSQNLYRVVTFEGGRSNLALGRRVQARLGIDPLLLYGHYQRAKSRIN